jgi:hypothetical protein
MREYNSVSLVQGNPASMKKKTTCISFVHVFKLGKKEIKKVQRGVGMKELATQ